MLESSYLTLLQSSYTNTYSSSNITSLSDLSSLLVTNKSETSSSDYAEKIVEVASSDAHKDVTNGNSDKWQNSDEYLQLKDEYVESGLSTSKNSSTYSASSFYGDTSSQYIMAMFDSLNKRNSKTSANDSYLTQMNNIFAQAMNDNVTRTVRELEFDLNYNYAYNAYKSIYSAEAQSAVDITV